MLYIASSEIPTARIPMRVSGGELITKQVFGLQSSLMVASRTGGYHSKPHWHACEQINYVTNGDIWIFVERRAYHLNTGDVLRIPANEVHWAWNRSEETCELIEVHSPGLRLVDNTQTPALLSEFESQDQLIDAPNEWADESYWEHEQEALAEAGAEMNA